MRINLLASATMALFLPLRATRSLIQRPLGEEMDTSTVGVAEHTLTRGGKRLRWMEEKRRIVEEVLWLGRSVPA